MVPLGITGGADNRTVFCERRHSPGTSSLSNTLSLQHQEPHHFAYSPYLSLERALGRVILFSWILWLSPWELPGLSWQWRERQAVCFFVKIFLPSFLSLRKAFSWTSSCEELVFWTDWNNLMNTWRLSVLFCHNCFFPKFSLVWIKNNLSWQLITMGKSGVYISFKSFTDWSRCVGSDARSAEGSVGVCMGKTRMVGIENRLTYKNFFF